VVVTPYYLLISTEDDGIRIDLDEPGWATTYHDWMRRPAVWFLVSKETDLPVLSVFVHDGEQPYYTARHVGITSSAGGNEITAYGIGKKQRNGDMVRVWLMPGGFVCGGDDVDDLGVRLVKALGPKQ
jgi:hypothetical protein